MQLAPMRYTRIEGSKVAVTVTSAAEARTALKELRHKKRELKFLRAALARRQRAVRAKLSTPSKKPRRSMLRRILSGFGWLIGWLFEAATVPKAERRTRDPQEIERELQRIDETLHNIEGCVLQLQGKMLTLGSS